MSQKSSVPIKHQLTNETELLVLFLVQKEVQYLENHGGMYFSNMFWKYVIGNFLFLILF